MCGERTTGGPGSTRGTRRWVPSHRVRRDRMHRGLAAAANLTRVRAVVNNHYSAASSLTLTPFLDAPCVGVHALTGRLLLHVHGRTDSTMDDVVAPLCSDTGGGRGSKG